MVGPKNNMFIKEVELEPFLAQDSVSGVHIMLDAAEALRAVRAPDGRGVYASADTLFRGAIFGRDSLEVAEDVLDKDPELVHEVLTTMAQLQGTKYDAATDQKPGKIIHEHRERPKDNPLALMIFNDVSKNFGGNEQSVTYYGSVDATPLYIRLMGRYIERQNNEEGILNEVVERSDDAVTFRESIEQAVRWLTDEIDSSPYGLLSFCHTSPTGKLTQAWKDSDEFMTHLDGKPANFDKAVVSTEVQGLAYDALIHAAQLLPGRSDEMLARARKLRDRALELLWGEQEGYFALGLDMDEQGNWRQILTDTATPAELLDTMFFDDLPEEQQKRYVSSLVERIFSDDFLTNAGIRSRAKRHAHVVPFWDYQGAYTTWPKETFDIARGLHKHGFQLLGQQLVNRLTNAVVKSGNKPEFIYVDLDGNALLGKECGEEVENAIIIDNVDKPEGIQAWTASAVLAARYIEYSSETGAAWKDDLQTAVLNKIPVIPLCTSEAELASYYPDLAFRRNGIVRSNSNFFYQHNAEVPLAG